MDIRDTIVEARRRRVAREGHAQNTVLPAERRLPIAPFGLSPFLVCEVKRRSPSRGDIAPTMDSVEQAAHYVSHGVRSISVLTETDYFSGSLNDLMRIKSRFPEVSVLRKDFLFDEEDIDVSHRAGADAILLIAAILEVEMLRRLYRRAKDLGMEVLLEIHGESDLQKARSLRPEVLGINCRDLETFRVDLLHPIRMRSRVDWDARVVFESGVRSVEDCHLALSSGFSGILVGESVVREPNLVGDLLKAWESAPGRDFWARLCARKRAHVPLVKICGVTNASDAAYAHQLGADILGFVFAPSKRQASPDLLSTLRDLDVLKAAVVVVEPDRGGKLDMNVRELLEQGLIDVVQFHGDEGPEDCFSMAFPYYKALRIASAADVDRIAEYRCPRVLLDSFAKGVRGGTGMSIPNSLVSQAMEQTTLWLAGGIGPENVGELVGGFKPELIDASSRLESSPGSKDHRRLSEYFQEIQRATVQ